MWVRLEDIQYYEAHRTLYTKPTTNIRQIVHLLTYMSISTKGTTPYICHTNTRCITLSRGDYPPPYETRLITSAQGARYVATCCSQLIKDTPREGMLTHTLCNLHTVYSAVTTPLERIFLCGFLYKCKKPQRKIMR